MDSEVNNTKQDTDYVDFFERYGTHFLKEVKFGATFTYEHKMSSQDYKTEKEQGGKCCGVRKLFKTLQCRGKFQYGFLAEKSPQFPEESRNSKVTNGAAPPANGDALTWAYNV